ncbi:RING finger protein 112-like [Bufo gargarizans]|uniref:RING finger protein 112-like n=1 Tax=Bufo gargarizans TaxID=30331 RepID=UPI001CF3711B|nr:RING finger protein 112-like [Bufo gargarizans]
MSNPGTQITCKEKGRLKDMTKEFQDSLRAYLSGVVQRVSLNIGPADRNNTFTCSKMFQKMMELVSYINYLKYNISSPSEVAVFLLDTEGSMDMEGDRKANIKMCMLTMLLSSHLVYNVNSSIKETDIDYLEIYCHGIGSDKRYKLKYFDFLIRNWYDPKKCATNDAESYINKETEVYMNKELQDSLRTYLSGVVKRIYLNIGPADYENTSTCRQMIGIMMEFVSYLNHLKYNISSPSEMYNMGKNQEHMEKIKNEFREFLNSWPMWRLRIGDTVANKISELQQKFKESFIYINEDDRKDQKEKLREYLVTEGDKFCRNHNTKLLLKGIPALDQTIMSTSFSHILSLQSLPQRHFEFLTSASFCLPSQCELTMFVVEVDVDLMEDPHFCIVISMTTY